MSNIKLRPLPPAISFFLIFLLGIVLAVLIAWLYTSWLPDRPSFDRWASLYRLAFYGLVLMGVLVAIKVVPTSTHLAKAITWPFSSIKVLLPQPEKPWQWLELIGGATFLGIVASVISFFVTQSTQESALRLQDQKERQELLTNYMNDMTQLIKEKPYNEMSNELKVAISSRTLNTLEALQGDGSRQGHVLRFAVRAFPNFTCANKSCRIPANISLRKISLKGFEIDGKNGIPSDLFVEANLREADMEESDLRRASLRGANMEGATLRKVKFGSEGFGIATFKGARLEGSEFLGSDLSEAKDFHEAIFRKAEPVILSFNSRLYEGFPYCKLLKEGSIRFTENGLTESSAKIYRAKLHNMLKDLKCDSEKEIKKI